MVARPLFYSNPETQNYVSTKAITFTWHSGFALSQKVKSVRSMHEAARTLGFTNVLEVSRRSESELGMSLSAFNLQLAVSGVGRIPVECAFQGSKVFAEYGSCTDLYGVPPRDAKRAAAERNKDDLVSFVFEGRTWDLEPKTALYDWIYIRALREQPDDLIEQLAEYDGFTDIEFNPAKSINCQARSCALAVALHRSGRLIEVLQSEDNYLRLMAGSATTQSSLPGLET